MRNDQRGVMLMHAIVVMALVALVVAVVAGSLGARAAAVRSATLSTQTIYASESGIASAVATLRAGDRLVSPHRGRVGPCTFEVVARRSASTGADVLVSTGSCGPRRHVTTLAPSRP